jgi:hypothetical protein
MGEVSTIGLDIAKYAQPGSAVSLGYVRFAKIRATFPRVHRDTWRQGRGPLIGQECRRFANTEACTLASPMRVPEDPLGCFFADLAHVEGLRFSSQRLGNVATHSPMRSQYRFDGRDSCDH